MKQEMRQIKGMHLVPGIVDGTAFVVARKPARQQENLQPIGNVDDEIKRFRKSLEEVKKELIFLKKKLPKSLKPVESPLIDVQSLIVDDAALAQEIEELIRSKNLSRESAIDDVLAKYERKFSHVRDPYLKDKFIDVKDVLTRIRERSSMEDQERKTDAPEKKILITEEILPSMVLSAKQHSYMGIVTVVGGLGSHATVLARSYGIPTVGISRSDLKKIDEGDHILIDGQKAIVYIRPENSIVEEAKKYADAFDNYFETIKELSKGKAETKDGETIGVYANCGAVDDVEHALEHGADGIGLFRTEFIFYGYAGFPSEEEQFEIYKDIVLRCPNKPITFRTLDIGGDKTLPYFLIPKQMNPYLGWRSLKISFDHPEEFKKQIKAIMRAGSFGDVKLLFPMVTTYSDVIQCKEFIGLSQKELELEGKEHNKNIQWGAMIEVPAAARCLRHIAQEIDFISIGTNDLIQYLLGVDRDNPHVADFYIPHHPAVISVIREIVQLSHEMGKPVSLCGEMARNPYYIVLLLGCGLKHLSMVPYFIPFLKDIIKVIDIQRAKSIFDEVTQFKTATEIFRHLQSHIKDIYPSLGYVMNL